MKRVKKRHMKRMKKCKRAKNRNMRHPQLKTSACSPLWMKPLCDRLRRLKWSSGSGRLSPKLEKEVLDLFTKQRMSTQQKRLL
uniref:uncharacterized protein isoform X4 n=1 Tax=Myxine glutinosa TaxID=7769 RepID=UPI00358F6615